MSSVAGKFTIGQRFLDAILHFFSRFPQLHRKRISPPRLWPSLGCLLTLLSMDRLEHFCYQLHLETKGYREHITVKCMMQRWYLASGTLLPQSPAYQDPCLQRRTLHHLGCDYGSVGRSWPNWPVFLHSLRDSQNLTISILIHHNRYQNIHILNSLPQLRRRQIPST